MEHQPPHKDKRAQWREQKRRYRQNHKAYTISYTLQDAAIVERAAEAAGLSVIQYLKKATEAYLNHGGYLLPTDQRLTELNKAIVKIGTNINQIIRYCHGNTNATYQDIENLQQQLHQLRAAVLATLTEPPHYPGTNHAD